MNSTHNAPQDSAQELALHLERLLPATPAEVFDAYTDPEQQKIWFSILDPKPGIVEITTDLRVGGQQVAVWGPTEDSLIREVQTFLEIARPHRLVTGSTGMSPDGTTMTTHITVTFEPRGDSTLMTVTQSGFPTTELRDFFLAEVWNGAVDRIEAYLKT